MKKVVSLSAHKNNKAQRHKKEIRKDANKQMRTCLSSGDIQGYFIMGWDENGKYNVAWNNGNEKYIKNYQMADYICSVVKRVTGDGD